jgi:hypothetical protein
MDPGCAPAYGDSPITFTEFMGALDEVRRYLAAPAEHGGAVVGCSAVINALAKPTRAQPLVK